MPSIHGLTKVRIIVSCRPQNPGEVVLKSFQVLTDQKQCDEAWVGHSELLPSSQTHAASNRRTVENDVVQFTGLGTKTVLGTARC
jgi:hypothetical protein